jgi:hypothetical protein
VEIHGSLFFIVLGGGADTPEAAYFGVKRKWTQKQLHRLLATGNNPKHEPRII